IRDRNVTGVQTCALPIYSCKALEGTPTVQPVVGETRAYEGGDVDPVELLIALGPPVVVQHPRSLLRAQIDLIIRPGSACAPGPHDHQPILADAAWASAVPPARQRLTRTDRRQV